jgi:hypothetical protein
MHETKFLSSLKLFGILPTVQSICLPFYLQWYYQLSKTIIKQHEFCANMMILIQSRMMGWMDEVLYQRASRADHVMRFLFHPVIVRSGTPPRSPPVLADDGIIDALSRCTTREPLPTPGHTWPHSSCRAAADATPSS